MVPPTARWSHFNEHDKANPQGHAQKSVTQVILVSVNLWLTISTNHPVSYWLPDCFLVATLLLLKMVDGVGDMIQWLGTLEISGFNSQNLHDSLQLPETPIPGDSASCSDLHGHDTVPQCTYIYAGKTHTKINKS